MNQRLHALSIEPYGSALACTLCGEALSIDNVTGTSQETMHNTVRRAELVNPICATQHPDNQAAEKKISNLGRREAYFMLETLI